MAVETYSVKPLGDVLRFKNGKSIKPETEGEFPAYGSNGLIGGSPEYREENTIILGRVGAYCGSVAFCPGKFWASDNTIVAYPKDDAFDIRFLSYLLRDLNLNRWAGGAAQPLLTQTVLKQIEAPVPELRV
ncbi:restriction endonuclease subunit S, partial [Thiolapillus sp.]